MPKFARPGPRTRISDDEPADEDVLARAHEAAGRQVSKAVGGGVAERLEIVGAVRVGEGARHRERVRREHAAEGLTLDARELERPAGLAGVRGDGPDSAAKHAGRKLMDDVEVVVGVDVDILPALKGRDSGREPK